tara:strand:+ start:4136 stop:4804 length:669 start_codon:yes stop_codon:yes gene_type:complete
MKNKYIVVGSRGVIGSEISSQVKKRGNNVYNLYAKDFIKLLSTERIQYITEFFHSNNIVYSKDSRLHIILAHRIRETDTKLALWNETIISTDLIDIIADLGYEVRVIVIGSITGRLIDSKSSPAYHYCKDLQKSAVRYSILKKNVCMNLIELSSFIKFDPSNWDEKYTRAVELEKCNLEQTEIPKLEDIANICISLLELPVTPRGQIYTFDNGSSLLQKSFI